MRAHTGTASTSFSHNIATQAHRSPNFDGLEHRCQSHVKGFNPRRADDCATCVRVRENHWAVGWVRWIAIHESDTEAKGGRRPPMVQTGKLSSLDEELFPANTETDEADTVWRDCCRPKERAVYVRRHRSQFEFRDFADMLNCLRGKVFRRIRQRTFELI